MDSDPLHFLEEECRANSSILVGLVSSDLYDTCLLHCYCLKKISCSATLYPALIIWPSSGSHSSNLRFLNSPREFWTTETELEPDRGEGRLDTFFICIQASSQSPSRLLLLSLKNSCVRKLPRKNRMLFTQTWSISCARPGSIKGMESQGKSSPSFV